MEYTFEKQTEDHNTSLLNLVKVAYNSRLFLLTLIIFTIHVFIIMGFLLLSIFYFSLYINNSPLLSNFVNNFSTNVYWPIIIFAKIPDIFACIGFWLFYLTLKQDIRIRGLSLLKGVFIFNIILIAFISLITAVPIFGLQMLFGLLSVKIIIPIYISIIFFAVLYQTRVIKIIDDIKFTIISNQPPKTISLFVIIINYIVGILLIYNSIVNFNWYIFITSSINGVFFILVSVVLQKYRKSMKILI